MSLFGESPPRESRAKSSGLFDDPPTNKAGAGLFADDGANGSPWDMPTPKKNARRTMIRSLLASTDVPEVYIETFDALLEKEGGSGGTISVSTAGEFVGKCNIAQGDAIKILDIVIGGGATGLGRPEFNVLMALIGLSQEGEELGLDAVDERKKRKCYWTPNMSCTDHVTGLPVPKVPSLRTARPAEPQKSPSPVEQRPAPFQAPSQRSAQFGNLESDPWSSPALHKGHDHSQQVRPVPYTNGGSSTGGPQRTTSDFTTASFGATEPSASTNFAPASQQSIGSEGGWGGSAAYTSGETAFGSGPGPSGNDPTRSPRPIGAGKRTGSSIEEEITVNLLEEKEGMFLFQHRNYEVASVRKNSKVTRRYSDFVWLLDCLYKRYPFRQLPLLPPKRVASE